MFETYRMLGEQQEAELIREAEKIARRAAVSSGRRRRRGRYGARAVVTALSYLRAGRVLKRVRLEINATEDNRLPSGRKGGAATPTR
jgi:hypothetical protein